MSTTNIKTKVHNRCGCLVCGDVIESIHRHDFVYCACRAIFTDGGNDYIRRGGDLDKIVNLPDDHSLQTWVHDMKARMITPISALAKLSVK